MENAKRMVLMDEKLLEYKPMLQHYQIKHGADRLRFGIFERTST
jgi:hypothetical protein